MTTLLAVYNSNRCVGRCDATCYNARHERCTCICRGLNHGRGEADAIAKTRELAAEWVDVVNTWAHEQGVTDDICVINRIDIPDAREARQRAYMRLHQLELPLDAGAS